MGKSSPVHVDQMSPNMKRKHQPSDDEEDKKAISLLSDDDEPYPYTPLFPTTPAIDTLEAVPGLPLLPPAPPMITRTWQEPTLIETWLSDNMKQLKEIMSYFKNQHSEQDFQAFFQQIPVLTGWFHPIIRQLEALRGEKVVLIVLYCPKHDKYLDMEINDDSLFTEVFISAITQTILKFSGTKCLVLDYRKQCRRTTKDNHCAMYTKKEMFLYGFCTAIEVLAARSVYGITISDTMGWSADVARETSGTSGLNLLYETLGAQYLGKRSSVPFHPSLFFGKSRGDVSIGILRNTMEPVLRRLSGMGGIADEWITDILSHLRIHPKTNPTFTNVIAVGQDDMGALSVLRDGLPNTPASYGRSCQTCAKAKCKCIFQASKDCCERCLRLKKECVPIVTVRHRNGRRPAGSRTAQLEEKLDGLVTLIRNQTQAQVPPKALDTNSDPSSLSPWISNTPAPSNDSQPDNTPNGNGQAQSQTNSACYTPDVSGNPLATGPQGAGSIMAAAFTPGPFQQQPELIPISAMICIREAPASQQEAEQHLQLFRERFLTCFPCVYLPDDMTSLQLRFERPFLWYTIMMVSSQSTSVQYAMGAVWQKIISQKMVVEHEKSMDLLQGLLVFLGWSHYHKKDRPYLSVYSQLATSLIYDLALNRAVGDPTGFSCFRHWGSTSKAKERTVEERRTVLACFYIMSQVACTVKKMDGLRWTAHFDDCLAVLDENPEYPGDEMLAALVRIQVIIDQINLDTPAAISQALPSSYLLSALFLHLDTVKKQLRPRLESNEFVRLQLHYAELTILENSLSRTPYNQTKPDFRRYETLSKTVACIKNWFEGFFSTFKDYSYGLSFSHWCQLAQCLMSLYRLTALNEPLWDRAALRRDIDLFQTCDRILADMEEVAARRRVASIRPNMPRSQFEADMFTTVTRIVINMRNVWALELGTVEPGPTGAATHQTENDIAGNINAAGPMSATFNFLDDAWLTDIFNVSRE